MRVPVKDFEGIYEISDKGEIFSMPRTIIYSDGHVHILKERKLLESYRNGYVRFCLRKNGKNYNFVLHRLVMICFSYKEGCEKLDVNHKDGNKKNNSIENLEWCTRSENILHSYYVLGNKPKAKY